MIMLNVLMKNFPQINNTSTGVLNADKSLISSSKSYKEFKKPTKEELKREDPQYKFTNTAYFFIINLLLY